MWLSWIQKKWDPKKLGFATWKVTKTQEESSLPTIIFQESSPKKWDPKNFGDFWRLDWMSERSEPQTYSVKPQNGAEKMLGLYYGINP